MRWIVAFVVAAAGAGAVAQEGLYVNGQRVEVGPPKAVAVGVSEVYWKKDGTALAYYATDADGTYLGVYDLNSNVARPMLRLAPGTHILSEQWLPNRPIYLMVTSVDDEARKTKHYEALSIDTRSKQASVVWSEDYALDAEVGLDVNASPSLDHAIITVTDPDGRHPIVLLDGGVSTVLSRDILKAWNEGMDFSGWSSDGTAYFGGPAETVEGQGLTLDLSTAALTQQGGVLEFKIKAEGNVLDSLPIIGFLFKMRPTAPAAGIPVYELMPRNAALRPVLSHGPFVDPEVLPHVVWPKDEEAVVRSDQKLDGTGAIWLVRLTGDEENPYGLEGVLVSGERGKSWMCEDGNWIAYEVAGALFVRRITYGGAAFSRALFGGGGR